MSTALSVVALVVSAVLLLGALFLPLSRLSGEHAQKRRVEAGKRPGRLAAESSNTLILVSISLMFSNALALNSVAANSHLLGLGISIGVLQTSMIVTLARLLRASTLEAKGQ